MIDELTDTPILVNVHISIDNDAPCIELRKKISDPALIKKIIDAGYHEKALILVPHFNNKLNALASLTKVGILYKDDKGKYQYAI